LVVASKRAVGHGYDYYAPVSLPKEKSKIRIRTRKSASPLLGVFAGVLMVTLLFSTGLSYTYLKAYTAKLYLEINRCSQENKAIAIQNEKLKLEEARLKSLERVEKIAQQKMGMIKNPQVEYLAMQIQERKVPSAAVEGDERPAVQEGANSISAGERLLKGIAAAILERGSEKKG
jgi:cell division protein FtsL